MLYEEEIIKLLNIPAVVALKPPLTNGFWGKTVEQAGHKLALLKKGLTELVLSTDEFHRPFMPYDYVENVFKANGHVQIPLKIY